jgi:4-amino-4-deoxy-L-arabinose transferase-like glycosyltransferase
MAGGIFHAYYLVTLAPPLSALAGIGLAGAWSAFRRGGWRCFLLPVALLLTAGWQAYIHYPYLGWKVDNWNDLVEKPAEMIELMANQVEEHFDWKNGVMVGLLGGTLVAVVSLCAAWLIGVRRPFVRRGAMLVTAIGWLALLTVPVSWALTNVLVKGNIMLPAADPNLLNPRNNAGRQPGGFRGMTLKNQELMTFLRANHKGERYFLAMTRTSEAAPLIIEYGEAVIAMGGFLGSDPILTADKFQELVDDNQIRFVMVNGFGGRRPGGNRDNREESVAERIQKIGKPVDRSLWQKDPLPDRRLDADGQPMRARGGRAARGGAGGQPMGGPGGPGGAGGAGGFGGFRGTQLYDCRPNEELVRVEWPKD